MGGPYVVKLIFHTIRNGSEREEFAPSGSKFFPLRKVPFFKRDEIEENHCLIQESLFDVRNFCSVLVTPLLLYIGYVYIGVKQIDMDFNGCE